MELTLKRLLEQADFAQAKKGYDRDEVDDFLDRAVAMATKVEAKLTQTMAEAKQASASPAGGQDPAEVEAEIERRVAARVAEERAAAPAPVAPAGPSEEERAEEMRRTLVLAQRTADAAIQEAREEAAKVRADAAREASDGRQELERQLAAERDEANDRIRREIAELEGVREALRTDVGVLERHVEEQRNQLRSTVGELQRLLEDPAGFRLAPTPALLDPVVPADEAGSVLADEPPAAPPAPTEPTPADEPTIDPEPTPEAVAPLFEPAPEAPEPEAPRRDLFAGPSATETTPTPEADAGPGGLSFGDVEHEPPAPSAGPPTEAIPATGDPFMDELRKAMSDDEPLGPRDDDDTTMRGRDLTPGFDDDDKRGWRFGKRR